MDYPIAGNDDAIRSVRMVLATVGQVITQAQAEYEAKYARRKSTEEAAPQPPAAEPAPVRWLRQPLPRPRRRPLRHQLFVRNAALAHAADAAFLLFAINYQLSTFNYGLFLWLKLLLPPVGKLREMTNAGMMDCKKALTEAKGDMSAAVDILRKKGAATATSKSVKEAREGVIAQYIAPGGRLGVLVEVNCQTDFVARNDMFRAFADDVARRLAADPNTNFEADRIDMVAKIRENIQIPRHSRMEVSGNGMVAAYIHTGAKVGVLVEVGAGKESTVANDDFKQLVKDITLQIAAGHPYAVSREQVPAEVVAKEREIAAQSDRLKGKPAQAIEKIIQGMLEKFYQTYCLVDQGFVKKNSEISVKEHVGSVAKQLGDEITIRRFVRFQVGEAPAV